jgi:DnaJ-domain-containing protein 1
MDINKWKSVAVRIDDYKILKAIAKTKFRAPASMISKLVNEYVKFQANKEKTTPEKFVKKLLNGSHDK